MVNRLAREAAPGARGGEPRRLLLRRAAPCSASTRRTCCGCSRAWSEGRVVNGVRVPPKTAADARSPSTACWRSARPLPAPDRLGSARCWQKKPKRSLQRSKRADATGAESWEVDHPCQRQLVQCRLVRSTGSELAARMPFTSRGSSGSPSKRAVGNRPSRCTPALVDERPAKPSATNTAGTKLRTRGKPRRTAAGNPRFRLEIQRAVSGPLTLGQPSSSSRIMSISAASPLLRTISQAR